jgi:hypothetical protein
MIYQGIRVYLYTRIPGFQNAFSISALERVTLPMSQFVLQGHIHARELPPGCSYVSIAEPPMRRKRASQLVRAAVRAHDRH